MKFLKQALIKAAGNRWAQNLLEKNVLVSHYLMGIGSGSGALSSGEQAVFRVLKQQSRPPCCIFDVGSNKGQFLQLIFDHVPVAEVSVHCFEPGRETFQELVRSAQPGWPVRFNNFGLGREKKEALLHFDCSGSGLASLTKRKLNHFDIDFEKSETVTIDTIDNYCAANSIDRIHLLKIDIEGHELDALAGAQRMFASRSVDLVTFEFGGCNIDTRTFFQDFWYFFRDAGFVLFRITPSGYLQPVTAYREMQEQFRTTNFLAKASGRSAA